MSFFKENKFHLFVIGSFIFNIVFKFIYIGHSAYSYDEMISVKDTLLDFGHIKHESEWDTNPPFYYYCIWCWQKIAGLSEFGIRSFSALFNALTLVILSYYLKRKFSEQIAIIFVILFTFHPFLFFYAQEARCYSLLLFITGLSIIAFDYFTTHKNLKSIMFLGLTNFLLIYTHYLSCFIIVFQGLYCLLFLRKSVLRFFISNSIMLFLILIRFTKKQILLIFNLSSDQVKDVWIEKSSFKSLISVLDDLYIHSFFFLVLLIISLMAYFKNKDYFKPEIIFFFAFMSLLTPLLFFGLGIKMPIFINRYIVYVVIFFLIIISIMLSNIKKDNYLLIILLVIIECYHISFGASKGIDYKSAAHFAQQINPKPMILINTKDVTGLFTYYYDIDLFKKASPNNKLEINKRNIYDFNTIDELRSINLNNQKVIVLFQTFDKEKNNIEVRNWFLQNKYKTKMFSLFKGVKTTVLTK